MKNIATALIAGLFASVAFAQTPVTNQAQTAAPDSSTPPAVGKAAAKHEKQEAKPAKGKHDKKGEAKDEKDSKEKRDGKEVKDMATSPVAAR